VIVTGIYGIVQYFTPLAWDLFWMENARMGSIGTPEPLKVRIFSTLNSPGPYSQVLMAGLTVMLVNQKVLSKCAMLPGYLSFALTAVRSAWGALVVALVYMMIIMKQRSKLYLLLIAVFVIGTVYPMTNVDPIERRMKTMEDIQSDTSYIQRVALYKRMGEIVLFSIVGNGFGSTGTATKLTNSAGILGKYGVFDSGVMNIAFVLGWPGTCFYLFGLFILISQTIIRRQIINDMFLCACHAIAVAILAKMLFGNTIIGVGGMVFWVFLTMAYTGRLYYKNITYEQN